MGPARPSVDWEELLSQRLPALAARLSARRLVLLADRGPDPREPSRSQIDAHDHPELSVVLKGTVDILTSSAPLRLRSGHILLVAPHMYHRSVAIARSAEAVWFRATPTHTGASLARILPDGRVEPEGGLDLIDFPDGHRVVDELIEEAIAAQRGWIDASRALLTRFFVHAWRRLGADGRVLPPDDAWSAAQIVTFNARHYIQKNYAHPLTLAQVAHHVALSPNYLAALFKRQFGRTIIDFLTEVRIEQAKELLKTTDRTVADVALAVGYQSPFYFSRAFKKAAGRSPNEFRHRPPS